MLSQLVHRKLLHQMAVRGLPDAGNLTSKCLAVHPSALNAYIQPYTVSYVCCKIRQLGCILLHKKGELGRSVVFCCTKEEAGVLSCVERYRMKEKHRDSHSFIGTNVIKGLLSAPVLFSKFQVHLCMGMPKFERKCGQ